MEKVRKNERKYFLIASGVLFGTSVVLQLMARRISGFGDWYSRHVYPLIVGSIGRISGLFPFSLTEIFAWILIIYGIVFLVRNFRQGEKILLRVLFLITGLFFLFTVNCGINYYRRPFSSVSGLEIQKSTSEELKNLCLKLTDTINQLSQEGISEVMDTDLYQIEGKLAMEKLGEIYPELSGYYPRPKPLLWSYFFSVQQLCGQYSPFTVEATYNRQMPAYNIPHTICHELSHLRGFMREDEANFIGYLACIDSDNQAFRYSGYLTGWVYATNALAKTDREAYVEISKSLSDEVWEDLRYNNEFWDRYDGRTAEVSNQLNDTYLKMNSQSDGVESYGRMVDLMLAYERAIQ